MKAIFTFVIILFGLQGFSQAPAVEWDNTIGGFSDDVGTSIRQTPDNGYILAGFSSSLVNGDKTGYDGGYDLWVLKLDSNGVIEWQNTIGGTNWEYYYSAPARMVIEPLSDGGYLLGGSSQSGISGDKTEINLGGTSDIWVLKLDELGNIIWQNTIGGAGTDYLSALLPIGGGGCIIGVQSDSPISADKLEASWGGYDYWIFELDEFGNIIWQNTIGGDQNDYLGSISKTEDGGYLLTGDSNSGITGDKSEPSVLGDYWIVKVDAVGNIIWDNTIGGLSSEFYARGIMATDSGYLIGGFSLSGIGLDKSQPQIGTYDYWVVKLTTDGEIVWDKTIGGGNLDYFSSLISTIDNGYLIGGYSNSGISGVKTDASHGYEDYWIVKLNEIGNIVWQKTIGGWGNENLREIIQTNDNGYALIGSSNSLASFEKTENYIGPSASSDYWVVKLAPDSCYSSIETCNGLDDDCNGIIDDSFIYTTYFADTDGDGFGDIDNVTSSCTGFPPVGYVVDSTDCNDLNILIHPDAIELCNGFDDNCNILIDEGLALYTFYFDGDEDGFGDASSSITLCNPVLPSGYSTDSTDCNDDNINVFPGAIELCNSIDDNCNGSIDEGFTIYVYFLDSDDDGFGDSDIAISTCLFPAPEGYVSDNTDCDDSNEFIHSAILYFTDADGDLYGDPFSPVLLCEVIAPPGYSTNDQDCDDTAFLINPGSNEICNGIDDNCNLEIDEGLTVFILYADVDGDAFGDKNNDTITCNANVTGYVNDSTDCDDTNPFIYPGATEILNGIDDDCDKIIDEGITDIINWTDKLMFSLYPNPNTGTFTIQANVMTQDFASPESKIEIYNNLGQLIFSKDINSNNGIINETIELKNITPGIYLIKLWNNNIQNVKNIIIE